jgi:hypothetical protein
MAFKVLMPKKRQQNQPAKKHLQQKVSLQTQACGWLGYSPESKEEPETSHQPLWGPASNVAKKATGLANAPT